jgi:hypothetical protein
MNHRCGVGDELLVTHFVPEVVGNRGIQRRVVFCDSVKLRLRCGVPRCVLAVVGVVA